MNFVADESVDRQIVEVLREDGHTVFYISEESPSIPDTEVLSRAKNSSAVLITADKDFGELVFRLNQNHNGIILLRLAGVSPEEKARVVSEFLKDHGNEVIEAFTVVSTSNIRIRSREQKDTGSTDAE